MAQKTLATLEDPSWQFVIPEENLPGFNTPSESSFEFLDIKATETSNFELERSVNEDAFNDAEANTNELNSNIGDSTYTTIEPSLNIEDSIYSNDASYNVPFNLDYQDLVSPISMIY